MEVASPARLYASVAGALLIVIGIVGFFYTASFGSPGEVERELAVMRVNGWLNALHVAAGALGLLMAGAAARAYALSMGVLFTALAIWGWAIGGGGEAVLGFLPASGGDEALHLVLGLLGLAAAAGTPKAPQSRGSFVKPETTKEPRNSEARAKVVGKRA